MVLAIDLGGSNIRIAEVLGTIIKNKKIIPNPKKKQLILNSLYDLISSYKKQPIGIGVASFLKNGLTVCTPNMQLENINLKSILSKKFNVPIFVENDANCAALGEHHFGHGKGKKNFFLLTLGTGIGGGTIINNKLYSGHRGTATEPGHMIIEGKHFEDIAAGPIATKMGKQAGLSIKNTFDLEALAKKGNKKAIAVYDKVGKRLGIALLNIAYILDPEIIILGGGFANVKFIYKEARSTLHKGDWAKRKIPVVHAKLKDDAGLIGASLLQHENQSK